MDSLSRNLSTENSSKRQTHRRAVSAAATLVSHNTQTRIADDLLPEEAVTGNAPANANGGATVAPLRHQYPSQVSSPSALSYPKSASFAPIRQPRGKDWESWKQDESIRLPEDVKVPWLPMVGKPFARSHERESRIDSLKYKSTPSLSISKVLQTFAYSPKGDFRNSQTASPVTLSPQYSATTESSKTTSPRSLSAKHDDLPKHISAFEYAINPFLRNNIDHELRLGLPSPTVQDGMSDLDPPLLPPPRDDEISYVGTSEGETEDENFAEDGIPSHLKEKDAFRTRMRLIQLRTLLARCLALQSTVHELERKPWAQKCTRPPYYYYSKMRNFAHRARRLAEALESRDLQARCEYWAGRACGGTRDWQAAAQHFSHAIKRDVQHDTYPSGRLRIRGLRPDEKEDVHFLLDSVTRRYESWLKKTADARWAARYEAEHTGRPIEACVNWDSLDSPTWLPDRDRIVQIAKMKLGKEANILASNERETIRIEKEKEVKWKYEDELNRRSLSEKEWRYIRYGDERTRKHKDSSIRSSRPRNPKKPNKHQGKDTASLSSSSGPSDTTAIQISPDPSLNLQEELEQAGWSSRTPSPPSFSRTPSPPTNLNQRRNRNLPPISTENIRKQESLGQAVHGSPLVSFGLLMETPSESHESEGEMVDIAYDDGSRAASLWNPTVSETLGQKSGSTTPRTAAFARPSPWLSRSTSGQTSRWVSAGYTPQAASFPGEHLDIERNNDEWLRMVDSELESEAGTAAGEGARSPSRGSNFSSEEDA